MTSTERTTIIHGDCLDVLPTLAGASVDAVVTDPPYGLEFMGKEWDGANGFRRSLNPADAGRPDVFGRSSRTSPEYRAGHLFQEWAERWAAECLRVLKPGGWFLAFGGTRTSHRLACAVEDAGFTIRDSIAWLYGSGFPKSKACLKPAHEPIIVARKGGSTRLNIDACRVDGIPWKAHDATGLGSVKFFTEGDAPVIHKEPHVAGRWPANVVLDEPQAAELDRMSGERASGSAHVLDATYGDTGGASRFFYVAKADSNERPRYRKQDAGPEWLADRDTRCTKCGRQKVNVPGAFCVCPEPDFQPDPKRTGWVAHPTVKPLSLMRWLVRLVTPPDGWVLDPFAGSGTTMEACVLEGFRCVAIEREADYLPLIHARLAQGAFDFEGTA